MPPTRRLAITVSGVVQGVGFRPFVYNAARACGLRGWVANEADRVRIEVSGRPENIDAFLDALRRDGPPQARIATITIDELPVISEGGDALEEAAASKDGAVPFEIRPSNYGNALPQPTIPADLATCGPCRDEINTPGERRYRYPFTNCTNCGPRWSLIERLPYDRLQTSMAGFAMCEACQAEYDDPTDRRFHAQPIACPHCGPVLRLLDGDGQELAVGDRALDETADALRVGRIVAMKGLGGFQLLVDATDAAAVARLRERKRRPDRPFALMLPTLEAVRQWCEVADQEAEALTSSAAPILLLRRRDTRHDIPQRDEVPCDDVPHDDVVPLAEDVAPGNPYLGVMLPCTPLHHLLASAVGRPLVCTSGNLSEEPMAVTTAEALDRLATIADLLLTHNRPIVRPVDDSVARLGPDGLQLLRRARGYAPLPLNLSLAAPPLLAVGGHLKNTVALALPSDGIVEQATGATGQMDETERAGGIPRPLFQTGATGVVPAGELHAMGQVDVLRPSGMARAVGFSGKVATTKVVVSAHIGDLSGVPSVEVHRRAIDDLVAFFDVVPRRVVCDLHPDYASTREAQRRADAWRVPLIRVQHHHAHVAACMAEHDLAGPLLGIAWDGTGCGTDGTIWGGEMLLCQRDTFVRAGHLRTFPLPGGDRAIQKPYRAAFGLLFEIFGKEAALHCPSDWFAAAEQTTLLALLERAAHTPRTSSMGRLFDVVAMLCGLPAVVSFEGQAAMALEYRALAYQESVPTADMAEQDAYRLVLSNTQPVVADWEPLVRRVLADREAGVSVGQIALRFHEALAQWAVATAQRCRCAHVLLTGGCFQNGLLTRLVQRRLADAGFDVRMHHDVPPGDGGIALGQLFVAAHRIAAETAVASAAKHTPE